MTRTTERMSWRKDGGRRVASIPLADGEELHVSRWQVDGAPAAVLLERSDRDGGITVPTSALPELRDALGEAEEVAP